MIRASAAAPGVATAIGAALLGQLRESLRVCDLEALKCFDALRLQLHDALGEAGCDALGHAIHNLKFSEALALLDQAGMS